MSTKKARLEEIIRDKNQTPHARFTAVADYIAGEKKQEDELEAAAKAEEERVKAEKEAAEKAAKEVEARNKEIAAQEEKDKKAGVKKN